ncbi:MAG: tRNA 2-thiouridine(34) synthase MnmA [Desulfococcus multivorans]|nr:tRNA 2-thiouridine(34) synthase MnmA [Desulfococcus multivorans]
MDNLLIADRDPGEKRQGAGRRILVAMSGGVDSSVAALLLKEAGCDVAGITMCLGFREGSGPVRCGGGDAIDDARRICDRLGIPHHVVDFNAEWEARIVNKFVAEYLRGRTPNPCVDCNRFLKFGALLDLTRAMGYESLATGHYARIERTESGFALCRARDAAKDQTYFLYPIAPADLGSILFPLGDRTKDEVRAAAREASLPVAEKAESQDICFVTEGNYRKFILDRLGRDAAGQPGDIVDRQGRVVGRHQGLPAYTVGQRSGLGISAPTPRYVLTMDVAGNRLVVGEKGDLLASGLWAGDLNLFQVPLPPEAKAGIRYRKRPVPCRLEIRDRRLRVLFSEPQEAVAPGQAVVLYEGDRVLGGGVIEEAIHEND